MEKTVSDIITNSIGAVAVCIIFLWYIDRQDQRTSDLIEKHLTNSNKAQAKMGTIVAKLTNAIDNLKEIIKNNKHGQQKS